MVTKPIGIIMMKVADGEVSIGDEVFVLRGQEIFKRKTIGGPGTFWDLPSMEGKMNASTSMIYKYEKNSLVALREIIALRYAVLINDMDEILNQGKCIAERLVELENGS